MSIPVVIDCDPGHDDAIALLLALASPELEVAAVTTVAGNSILANTTANALRVLEKAGRVDVPVAAGADRPLVSPLVTAPEVHGASGLGGPRLDPPRAQPDSRHGVDLLAEVITTHSEPVTVVAVGPLTNLALLLAIHPEVAADIRRVVVMGGSVGLGNVTPAAEFNIYVDPEAARRVFSAGLDLTMIGLDVTHLALLDTGHAERLRGVGECGRFVAELLDYFIAHHPRTYERPGAPIHDAVAVAEVIWPGLVHTEELAVTVDVTDGPSRGRTVVDRWQVTGARPNARVGLGLDGEGFADRLCDRLGGLP